MAGLIVTKVTGRGIGTEITERIVKRLGLRGTYWPGDRTTLPEPDLRSYVKRSGKLRDWTEWNTSGADASGALVSTAADVTAFWSALMSGRLLAPAQDEGGRSRGYGVQPQGRAAGLRQGAERTDVHACSSPTSSAAPSARRGTGGRGSATDRTCAVHAPGAASRAGVPTASAWPERCAGP
ncbi:beta-lactamase family protein [Streptomyces sp. MNP-20]|uniref:beta-lactamase family protein n=1 Tax=Streptomyces sp. MNP-20 TaxID=2721165 RepID=UPI0020A6628D|nr:beta-lactamase family protein [Streptomyces sp. MNP-20]